MIRSIVVPLDGSPFAEHALPAAVAIARACRAKLRLVTVHEPPAPPLAADDAAIYVQVDVGLRRAERVYLKDQASKVRKAGVALVVTALLDPPVAEALAEHAAARGADLVVMTTHGRGPLTRLWLGSVADELIRRIAVPVLLIRPREGAPDPIPTPGRRILLPLDGSPIGEAAVSPAAELAERLDLGLRLVQVVVPPPLVGVAPAVFPADLDDEVELHRREAEDYLEDVAAGLRERGLSVETAAIVYGSVADALLELARGDDVALAALSTHGRGGLQRLLLGSVADKLVRSAERPVLVVRPVGSTKSGRAAKPTSARVRITR
jgi:nucleotide-binding universal stress UspA family protein